MLLGRTDRHDQTRVALQNGAHLAGTQVLQPQGIRLHRPVAHWEFAAVATAALLAAWLRVPVLALVAGALVLGALAVALAARARPTAALLVGAAVVIGAGAAWRTSVRATAAADAWAELRWQLVDSAGRRLSGELADAVTQVRELAAASADAAALDRAAAQARITSLLGGRGPERGIMLFDDAGRPWVWGGRHRMAAARTVGLEVRITPFYAVLSAGRQGPGGRLAVAHLLLAADSVAPDTRLTLAERFRDATGAGLQVFPPGGGPFQDDVFDYCVPDCSATDVVPDTLFSVRLVPPSQGAFRADVLRVGTAWVAAALVMLLLVLVAFGSGWTGAAGLVALGATLVLTPAGRSLPTGRWFSSAVYFDELLGPFSASAGALLVTAAITAAVAVVLGSRQRRIRPALVGALAVVGAAPFVLQGLASGITPPNAGVDGALWMTWHVALAFSGVAVLLLGGAFARLGAAPSQSRWTIGGALILTPVLAVAGLSLWEPLGGWPVWYVAAWALPFALTVLPGQRVWGVVLMATVSGALAAVLTWGAAADGRVLLADRDVAGVRQGSDPIALGLLERFGASLAADPAPRDAAELYARWRRSPLEADRYPATLSVWSATGIERVRFELARLSDLNPTHVQDAIRQARSAGRLSVHSHALASGAHYVLAAPTADGAIVTVGLGPRTRLVPPVRVARFLRGERVLAPPYVLALSAPGAGDTATALRWRRDRWAARGETRVVVGGLGRRLLAEVPLGIPSSLLLRGVLAVVVDLVVALVLWAIAEHVAGRTVIRLPTRDFVARPSYRRRLAGAFAVFFVVPTMIFAAWVGARLDEEARRTRDVTTQQVLAEAVGEVRALGPADPLGADRVLDGLAERLDADLVLYQGGELWATNADILAELGLFDWYLRPSVRSGLGQLGQMDLATDQRLAGRATRVGYRDVESGPGPDRVLAAPRLLEDPDSLRNERDLVLGLILVTLGGLAAALALAGLAARALATPVQALERAAQQVGRGELPEPFSPDAPGEFAPVMEAFERMARDVRASQAALDAARRRTAAVLRNVATGVVALDAQFRVVTSNPRAEELLGTGLPPGDAIRDRTGDDWLPVWTWVRTAGDEEEPREFTVGERQIRVQVAPLGGGGRVVALDDVTDLSRVVRVLAWGELAQQIAHEIKNPLTPIRLGVQHLRRAFDAPHADYAAVLDRTSRQILAEIERLDAIARAFSRFGAPPSGAEPLGPVEAYDVARDTATLYTLSEAGRVVVEGEPVRVVARRDELKEVLINLVENARAAGATTVTIRVEPREADALLAVHDDGEGIAAEDLPRVLEPRFSTTTSGTGLGLAICRRLVESWGGRIAVESTPGMGTTIQIRLARHTA